MKALGREHMTLDQLEQRHEGEGSVADLVGQRRQRQVDPLGPKTHALAIERDMHAELVEQDRRQQLRADEAARRGMERRGISSSVLVTSSPTFASRDPPQQAQLVGASMMTRSRSMSSGQGLRTGRLRVKGRTFCVFAAAACAASSFSVAVVASSSSSNSNCSSSRAVRSERCPCSSRLSFSIRSSRCAISAALSDSSACALAAIASARSRASRSACSAAKALTRSDGRSSGFDIMKPLNQIEQQIQTQNGYPTRVGRWVSCGLRQSIPDSR